MPPHSAGLLLYRRSETSVEVLLVHPGGPYWVRRDDGAWSIPKGEYDLGEEPRAVAEREFREELGSEPPAEDALDLGEVRQAGGKVVCAWAVPGDIDVSKVVSNTFEMEWPPRSGRRAEFPEIDRAAWFDITDAHAKIVGAQAGFLDRLLQILGIEPGH